MPRNFCRKIPTGGMLLDFPGGLVMVVFYNVFLLLFMFVVITRLVAGHWIVPFAPYYY